MNGTPVARYMVAVPETGMTGDILALGTFAGTAVGEVRDVPPAGELVHRLWRKYEQARG